MPGFLIGTTGRATDTTFWAYAEGQVGLWGAWADRPSVIIKRTWALVVSVANVVCPFEVYCLVESGVILEIEDVFV